MRKRIVALVATLCVAAGFWTYAGELPYVSAEEIAAQQQQKEGQQYENGFYYNTVNGYVEIIGYDGNAQNLVIPSMLGGNQVTNIAARAFEEQDNLKEVVIPEGVLAIGTNAFWKCENLVRITIPSSVNYMEWNVFVQCKSLREINVSEDNSLLMSEDGVLFDKNKTCLMCYPAGKEQASYTVSSEVEKIDMAAFSFAGNLTEISIPDSVYEIGGYAFSNCKGLKRLDIPSGVEDIPFGMVQGCTGLTEITIPASVTSIGRAFFDDCDNLEAIQVQENNPQYCSEDGVLLNKEKTVLLQYPANKKGSLEAVLKKVGGLGEYSLSGCRNIGSLLVIPENVTSIAYRAFYYYDYLDGIVILNKDCKLDYFLNDVWQTDHEITIYGYPGSTAHAYAEQYGEKFADITTTHVYQQTALKKAAVGSNGRITETCTICGKQKNSIIFAPKVASLSQSTLTYNGNEQKVNVTVMDVVGRIIPSTDYSVAFSNNQNVGEALVTVTLKGNYTGILKKSFRIVPKGTSLTKIKARKKGFTVKWKKQDAQTTGYEVQYSTKSNFKGSTAKTVRVKKNKIISRTVSKLKPKKRYYVRIRTYKTVKVNGVNTNLYSGWSKVKKVVTKR